MTESDDLGHLGGSRDDEYVWQKGQRAEYTDESLLGVVVDSYRDFGGVQRVVFRPENGLEFECSADHLLPADDPFQPEPEPEQESA